MVKLYMKPGIYTLLPSYNKQFDSQKFVRSIRVLVVAESFNILVSEMTLTVQ